MALISVNYTPQITSDPVNSSPFICHRICYRLGSSGPFCCIEDVTASVSGVPKSFDITVAAVPCGSVPDVDPDDCSNTVYEGYVQACCEAEISLSGRTPFTAEFTADPSCINKIVCCQSQRPILDAYLVITDPGSGYDPASTGMPLIVVRDPSDTAAGDAVIEVTISGGGLVTALTTTTPGLYSITPLLIIPSPGGGGTTASAIAVIPCADDKWKGNCDTSPQTTEQETMLLGECANICLPEAFPFIYSADDLSGLPDITNYNYAAGGCCNCSTCRNYTVVTGSDQEFVNICYTICSIGGSPAEENCVIDFYPGSGSFDLTCVVPGSIYCTNDVGAILSITDTGACGSCP